MSKRGQIGVVDATEEQRAKLIRERRAEQQRRRRRKQGMTPRNESVAAMARAAGIKPDTLRKRLRRARLKVDDVGGGP